MNMLKNWYALFLIAVAFACLPFVSAAQNDTIKKRSLDEYLLTRKGIFGKLTKILMTDTAKDNASAEP